MLYNKGGDFKMKILDFIEISGMSNKPECEKAKLLCYYYYKENAIAEFSISLIADLMIQSGYNTPNKSRLRDKLIKGKEKGFILVKGTKGKLEFIATILQKIDNEFGEAWNDTEKIETASEIIDEVKFCGKRKYLDKLIAQINHSYSNNCFDASAVLMRRLFEVMLVLSYQNLGIDSEIKDLSGSGYLMLEGIVNNAKNNTTLKLSRIKNKFDEFRKVGNFSAHSITYTAGKKDIDDIKLDYRVMLEELYNKAGLV